jgi:hypothetical protein
MSPNIQKSSAKAFRTYDFENELFRISDALKFTANYKTLCA